MTLDKYDNKKKRMFFSAKNIYKPIKCKRLSLKSESRPQKDSLDFL
jgi:hypothetical protein